MVDPEELDVCNHGNDAVDDGIGFGSIFAGQFLVFALTSEGLHLIVVLIVGVVILGELHWYLYGRQMILVSIRTLRCVLLELVW